MSRRTEIVTVLIPLPTFYNPDPAGVRRPVEDEKFMATAEEVALRFSGGGILWRFPFGSAPTGYWWDRGVLHRDVLAVLELDIPDTAENRARISTYAADVLIDRFQQEAIYLKFYGGAATATTEMVTKKIGGGIRE